MLLQAEQLITILSEIFEGPGSCLMQLLVLGRICISQMFALCKQILVYFILLVQFFWTIFAQRVAQMI